MCQNTSSSGGPAPADLPRLRPIRQRASGSRVAGRESPLHNGHEIDWVVIRENSEGEYSGNGGRVHRGLPEEVATEVSVFTRAGVERIHRFAFELARARPRKHLTMVTKSNAQRHGMVLWDEIFYEVAKASAPRAGQGAYRGRGRG